jgi:EAL domain-containing protein (putative c-di-GMP-specific phosphodiesterase class I)
VVGDESFDCIAVADQVLERYHLPWETEGMPLLVTARLAVLSPTDQIKEAFDVLSTMDTALDEAIMQETDKLVVEEEMLEKFNEHVRVYRALLDAMENDKVEVYLQPLYSTVQGRVTRAEALARLRDEDGSFIAPDIFISIAEGAGLINRLGEVIFEKVCVFAEENDLDELGIECINVNLSPLQCMSYELPERLFSLAEKHNVSMDRFHLEITESAMVDVSVLRQQMGLIITTGTQFSLDDYGTGYSNLTRMASLPFANVKIDQSIVWDYFKGVNTFLPSLVSTFHDQGFEVTAEGVETLEMKEGLEEMKCELLQGYYFSRPLPPEEFVNYVRESNNK